MNINIINLINYKDLLQILFELNTDICSYLPCQGEFKRDVSSKNITKYNGFSKIPFEIKNIIRSYLPSQDEFKLDVSSKAIYSELQQQIGIKVEALVAMSKDNYQASIDAKEFLMILNDPNFESNASWVLSRVINHENWKSWCSLKLGYIVKHTKVQELANQKIIPMNQGRSSHLAHNPYNPVTLNDFCKRIEQWYEQNTSEQKKYEMGYQNFQQYFLFPSLRNEIAIRCKFLVVETLKLTCEEIDVIPIGVIAKILKNTAAAYHPAGNNDHDQWRYEQLSPYIPKSKRLTWTERERLKGLEQLQNS